MAASAQLYGNFLPQALAKNINLTSDTLKMALLGSGYAPDLIADVHWSDISAHEVTGTGYSAGGVALSSVTLTLTAANSWGVSWASTTVYGYGQIVRPSSGNGFVYRCVVGGTSGGSAPSFPTVVGETVTDGGVTWACLGASVLVFTSGTVTWATATLTASFAVIYDAQSGTPSTEPLIVLESFAAPQNPSAQNYQQIPDSVTGWFAFSPPS